MVCFPFAGHLVGGSHLSAAKLIQHLDQARYRPLVVLHRPEGDMAELFRAHGIAFEPGIELSVEQFFIPCDVVADRPIRGLQ